MFGLRRFIIDCQRMHRAAFGPDCVKTHVSNFFVRDLIFLITGLLVSGFNKITQGTMGAWDETVHRAART